MVIGILGLALLAAPCLAVDFNPNVIRQASGAADSVVGLSMEGISGVKGSQVQMEVFGEGLTDVTNMDLTIIFNAELAETAPELLGQSLGLWTGGGGPLRLVRTEKGSLTENALFASANGSFKEDLSALSGEWEGQRVTFDQVKISLTDPKGMTGSGTIAVLVFEVVNDRDENGPAATQVWFPPADPPKGNTRGGAPITFRAEPGYFVAVTTAGSDGDGDGDGQVTTADALMALQVAVGGIALQDVPGGAGSLDLTNDGQVTSQDAYEIQVLGLKNAAAGRTDGATGSAGATGGRQNAVMEQALLQAGIGLVSSDTLSVTPITIPSPPSPNRVGFDPIPIPQPADVARVTALVRNLGGKGATPITIPNPPAPNNRGIAPIPLP